MGRTVRPVVPPYGISMAQASEAMERLTMAIGGRPRSPANWPASYTNELQKRKRGRHSLLPWRRRRAYQALLLLIEWREAVLQEDTHA